MALSRRNLMKLGTAVTVGTMLPRAGIGAPPQNDSFEAEFQSVLGRLRSALAHHGYQERPALPIASGNPDFNGGLRHDFDQFALPQNAFVVQPLARVADVDERSRTDILPLFHEVGCHPPDGVGPDRQIGIMVRVLTDDFGLDPSRIAFVSVPQSETLRPVLDQLGLTYSEKVLLRAEEEALAARDASGFFFPDPFGDDYQVTMGVYYRIGDVDEPAPTAYPPAANWTEIGEVIIAGGAAPLGMSFGAERLTLAATGQFPSWDERLGPLLARVEADVAEGGEPPGIAAFR